VNSDGSSRSRKSGETLLDRLDSRIKLLAGAAVLLMTIFLPMGNGIRHGALFLLMTAALILARVPMRRVGGRLLLLFPMLAGIGLISLVFGRDSFGYRLDALLSLSVKAVLCLLCVIALMATIKLPSLIRALSALRVPRIMIDILGFGIRYAGVFGSEVRRLRYALISRSGGRMSRIRMVKTSAALIPRLVFKALERSERIYAAMLSRGFTGRMPAGESRRLDSRDLFFALLLGIYLTAIGCLG